MRYFSVNRRLFVKLASLSGALVPAGRATSKAVGNGRCAIVGLRVNGCIEPLSIDTAVMRLSWRVEGFDQATYRVLAASSPDNLVAGRAYRWDSGAITSAATLDIAYRGRDLNSGERAYWRVECTDLNGRTVRSEVASWSMGLLKSCDWKGAWLAAECNELAGDRSAGLAWIWGADPVVKTPQLFRYQLDLRDAPVDAVAQLVAQDSIDRVWLDGVELHWERFKPGVVNNTRMHTVGLTLGAGRHEFVVEATYHPERGPASASGAMAAVIRLRYADGKVSRITTEMGWTVAHSVAGAKQQPASAGPWVPAQPARSKPVSDPWAAGPAMYLRKSFAAPRGVTRAILHATALGAYYVHLNGQRISDALLAPECTDFTRRVQYQTYDVTTLLHDGANMLGAIVGDGWYGSTGLFGGRYDFGPAPCRFLAQLTIEHSNGSVQTIVTDESWETASSPVRASEIYDGEFYDARLELDSWDKPYASSVNWTRVQLAPSPPCRVVAQPDPPIRALRTLQPVTVHTIRPGVHVIDFGQNFAGWITFQASASAGTSVVMRYGELLLPSGEVDQSNLRSAKARTRYTFRGAGVETYCPHFTYFGFRYVQVEGWPGTLPQDAISAQVLHTDLPETGTFTISDPLVQKLWLNTLWSQRSNFIGLPTDCPQRDERLGWMGDAQVFWDAASFNMDVETFTRRFMGDVRDAQDLDGTFAEYNPQSRHARMKGAPGWADAGVILPWTSWWRTGDTSVIDENWEAMVRYCDHIFASNPDGVWRNGRGSDYGDWLALDAKGAGDATTPKDLIGTAMWAFTSACMADMAQAIGRTEDRDRFLARRATIVTAFSKEFVLADGVVGSGSQTGYLLALRHKLLAPDVAREAARLLVADINRRGHLLSTGFLGTPIALDVLLDIGAGDLVYSLLRRKEFPSWGYMAAKGATTIWERWNGDTGDLSMNSFNHYALGAVVGCLYRRIAGISPLTPGFTNILIAPEMRLGFDSAGAVYDSPMGRIETSWTRSAKGITLDVAVPFNTRATARFLIFAGEHVRLDGKVLDTDSLGEMSPDVARPRLFEHLVAPGRHKLHVVTRP